MTVDFEVLRWIRRSVEEEMDGDVIAARSAKEEAVDDGVDCNIHATCFCEVFEVTACCGFLAEVDELAGHVDWMGFRYKKR